MKYLLFILLLAVTACSKQTKPAPYVATSKTPYKATQVLTGVLLEVNRTGNPQRQTIGFRVSWEGGGYNDYELVCPMGELYTSRLVVTSKIMKGCIFY